MKGRWGPEGPPGSAHPWRWLWGALLGGHSSGTHRAQLGLEGWERFASPAGSAKTNKPQQSQAWRQRPP